MSESQTAVLDRIVDGETAVLLCEADGEVVEELTVPVTELPDDGRKEGAVFSITVAGDELETIEYRSEETESRREAAQNRFDQLSERLGDG